MKSLAIWIPADNVYLTDSLSSENMLSFLLRENVWATVLGAAANQRRDKLENV